MSKQRNVSVAYTRSDKPTTILNRANGQPTIVGYAAVFFRASDLGTQYQLGPGVVERIRPGAFDRAMKEDDVVGLFNHDASLVLGRESAGTLRLSVDDRGLRYEITPPDSPVGHNVIEAIRRGDVTGSSFSFNTIRADRSTPGVVVLEDVRLFDVGPVTFPAYAGTDVAIRRTNLPPAALADRDALDLQLTLMKFDTDNDARKDQSSLRNFVAQMNRPHPKQRKGPRTYKKMTMLNNYDVGVRTFYDDPEFGPVRLD